jgi:hypothetical protein
MPDHRQPLVARRFADRRQRIGRQAVVDLDAVDIDRRQLFDDRAPFFRVAGNLRAGPQRRIAVDDRAAREDARAGELAAPDTFFSLRAFSLTVRLFGPSETPRTVVTPCARKRKPKSSACRR